MQWHYVVITMNNSLITLITVLGEEKDSSGFKTGEIKKEVEVFAEVKDVGRIEFYEAMRSSIEAKVIFVMDADDYLLSAEKITLKNGKTKELKASKIKYENKEYLIIRTYQNNTTGMLEATCREIE